MHCAGMCGGIVTALSLGLPDDRSRLPLHLGYNIGRVASYAAAGALAGGIGSTALLAEHLFPAGRVLYALANLMLVLLGLYLAGLSRFVTRIERAGGWLWDRLQPLLKYVLPVNSLPRALAAGVLWGWLPCGLVYSVLISALATGGAVKGALLMLAFGLGTFPNLLGMGFLAAKLLPFLQRRGVRLAAGLLVASFGVWGLARLAAL